MLTLENVCDRLILCTIMLAIIYTVMCSLGDVFTVRSVTPVHCFILLLVVYRALRGDVKRGGVEKPL